MLYVLKTDLLDSSSVDCGVFDDVDDDVSEWCRLIEDNGVIKTEDF